MIGRHVEDLLYKLRDSDNINTSAYMFVAVRVRSGKIRKDELEKLVRFVEEADYVVHKDDLAMYY